MRLALDHLTAVDTRPAELAEIAATAGYGGICLFLQSMAVLPRMPRFDLVADAAARRDLRTRCRDLGLTVDLAYPFTLGGRSAPGDFQAALDAAADLGAACVNALLYDRDPVRRLDTFAGFCERAAEVGLKVAVEFYPPSQVRTLRAASALIEAASPPGTAGITLDLLHLVRSGGSVADIADVPSDRIFIAQVCDGPAVADPERLVAEAAEQRMLPGQGAFDVRGFLAALPATARLSAEVPQEDCIRRGLAPLERAAAALAATRAVLEAARRESRPD